MNRPADAMEFHPDDPLATPAVYGRAAVRISFKELHDNYKAYCRSKYTDVGIGVEKLDVDYIEAFVKLLGILADRGCARAMEILGHFYAHGKYSFKQDQKKADEYRAYAAILRNSQWYGDDVEGTEKRVFESLQQCAQAGNRTAQYGLACCYQRGRGIQADAKKAFHLFGVVSEDDQLYPWSISGLEKVIECYEEGIWVPRDTSRARELRLLGQEYKYDLDYALDNRRTRRLYWRKCCLRDLLMCCAHYPDHNPGSPFSGLPCDVVCVIIKFVDLDVFAKRTPASVASAPWWEFAWREIHDFWQKRMDERKRTHPRIDE